MVLMYLHILLKSYKTTIQEMLTPQTDYKPTFTQPTFDAREKYANILGETAMSDLIFN